MGNHKTCRYCLEEALIGTRHDCQGRRNAKLDGVQVRADDDWNFLPISVTGPVEASRSGAEFNPHISGDRVAST
jgi:hypothetical protein